MNEKQTPAGKGLEGSALPVTLASSMVSMLTLTDMKHLDPIRVITEDYHPGAGRITITCWNQAWVGYWGGMGECSISEFFTGCDADYLVGNLASGLKQTKAKNAYLIRIIEAVRSGLRKHNEGAV